MSSPSPKIQHWSTAALFAIAVGAAFWRGPVAEPPAFASPSEAPAHSAASGIASGMLPAAGAVAGPASLTLLTDGRVAAAWLAGPADDESAAAIWLSVLGRQGWSEPQRAATRESTAAGTFAHLNKLGRPVLFAEGSWLHLWYESLPLGNWAGAAILHSVSTNAGKSWSRAERLAVSPFGALGSGLGGTPVALADGGLALPIDRRFPGHGGEWLRLSATGRLLDKQRLAHAASAQQPAAVALDEQKGLAILRGRQNGDIRPALATANGGQLWETVDTATLPASDSAVALLRLASGRLLAAANPPAGKEALQLWLSTDGGHAWSLKRTIEAAADGGAEFTDPALLLGRDGRIHLAYTWRRQGIKHVAFDESWLDGGTP